MAEHGEPGHNSGEEVTTQVGGIAADRLKSFVERVERVKEEIRSLQTDVSDIYKEAESAGFDKKALKEVIRRRAIEDVDHFDGVVSTYEHALSHGQPTANTARHRGNTTSGTEDATRAGAGASAHDAHAGAGTHEAANGNEEVAPDPGFLAAAGDAGVRNPNGDDASASSDQAGPDAGPEGEGAAQGIVAYQSNSDPQPSDDEGDEYLEGMMQRRAPDGAEPFDGEEGLMVERDTVLDVDDDEDEAPGFLTHR